MKVLLLLCALSVPPGTHLVTLTAYYHHEDPQRAMFPYVSSDSKNIAGPVEVYPNAEGYPAAFEWWIDGVSVKTCGEIPWPETPDRIFRDGFENGDTSGWSRQEPQGGISTTKNESGEPSLTSGKSASLKTSESSGSSLKRYWLETKRRLKHLQNKHLKRGTDDE